MNNTLIELGMDLRVGRRLEMDGVETVEQLRAWRAGHPNGSDAIGRVMLADVDRFLSEHPAL